MEVNITEIMTGHTLADYSDSIANSGKHDIGQITWRNACEAIESLEAPLVSSEGQGDLRNWLADFGAWTRKEIGAMSDVETQAILLQMVAGDGQSYLEAEENGRLAEWEETEGGSIYKGDNGEWYYYVGI